MAASISSGGNKIFISESESFKPEWRSMTKENTSESSSSESSPTVSKTEHKRR